MILTPAYAKVFKADILRDIAFAGAIGEECYRTARIDNHFHFAVFVRNQGGLTDFDDAATTGFSAFFRLDQTPERRAKAHPMLSVARIAKSHEGIILGVHH